MARRNDRRGTTTDGVDGVPAVAAGRRGGPFGLLDVETGNMVGSFPSEREALLAVAATARDFGADSAAVLSLALFRDDVPPEDGFVADGAELVRRALAAAQAAGAPMGQLPT
jgi:hypothetical protein